MATTKEVLRIARDIAQDTIRDIDFSSVVDRADTDGFTNEELELVHTFATQHLATSPIRSNR